MSQLLCGEECLNSYPRYYSEVRFTVSIEMQKPYNHTYTERILTSRIKSYVETGELYHFYWERNLNEITDIFTEYRTCSIAATQSPSAVPTYVTASPSLPKNIYTVSVPFVVSLSHGKNARELSDCCRNRMINAARKTINKVVKILLERKLRHLLTKEININSSVQNRIPIIHRKTREEGDIACTIFSFKDNAGECSL